MGFHTAKIQEKRAKKCARAYNGSFCHLWGILNLQGPKKQKSTENQSDESHGVFASEVHILTDLSKKLKRPYISKLIRSDLLLIIIIHKSC